MADITADDWLSALTAALDASEPLLVLCRGTATSRAVYRQLAARAAAGGRRGFPGVQVTTPQALFSESAPGRLIPREATALPAVPASHPWHDQLEGRPGLVSLLRQHMRRVHETALAEPARTSGLRAEIAALLKAGWGEPDSVAGARQLLASTPATRCIAVGFPPEPFSAGGTISPLARALLRHLQAELVDAGDPANLTRDALPALRVPDTAAEARVAARAAARPTQGSVLILVASAATEERVRAALARNGIATANDGSDPLRRHALAALAEPLLPAFLSRGADPVEARDLLRVLTDPVLARTARDPDAAGKDDTQDDKTHDRAPKLRASVKHLREMLVETRCARATVDEWSRLAAQIVAAARIDREKADEDHKEQLQRRFESARVLQIRLDELREQAHGDGRLGDLHRFLSGMKLSEPSEDRIGRAVLRALGAAAHLPAEAESFQWALSGASSSGRVDKGVEILPYQAYDGRPAGRLLLLDVHNKGLSRLPAPDPLLSTADQQALGTPAPADCIREHLAMARWAASRARQTLAVVTATDASGRTVSPPLELELRFEGEPLSSYGLQVELPEWQDRQALAEGRGQPSALATQIDVEWVRRGAWLGEARHPAPMTDLAPALPEVLEHELPRIPDDLRPWLGEAGTCPGSMDGLPAGFTLSASRCQAFTGCLYHAFCQSVLRLKASEEISEDLDARDVGTAVHASLNQALEGVQLLVPSGGDVQAMRKNVARVLRSTLPAAMDRGASSLSSDALALSRMGVARRWAAFMEGYLVRRIRDVADAEAGDRWRVVKPFKLAPAFLQAVDALGPRIAKTQRTQLIRNLAAALVETGGDFDQLVASPTLMTGLSGRSSPVVATSLRDRKALNMVRAMCDEVQPLLSDIVYARRGDLRVLGGEIPFGTMEEGEPPLVLPLGRAGMPVRGSIDLVVHHRGRRAQGTAYQVIDFKTGKYRPKEHQIGHAVTRPQLAMYALALEEMGPIDRKHEAPVRVSRAELDVVRAGSVAVWVDDSLRRRWREVLGVVFDLARAGSYPAVPHPDCCPMLTRGAFCDFADICRVRAGSRDDSGDEEATS